MSTHATHPILTKRALISLLAEPERTPCYHCRGRGSIVVDDPRNPRICPPCAGTGLAPVRIPRPSDRPF